MNIEVSDEYLEVAQCIKNKQPVFVTGGAGTGKSTLIEWLRNKFGGVLVVAPTGIAAINVAGKTIHSTFQFPPAFIQGSDIKILHASKREVLKRCRVLIIDEISMVNPNLLDSIDTCLRLNRATNTAFGGVSVVLVGDLFQLPPVVGQLSEIFESRYDTTRFFSSHVYKSMDFKTIILQKTHRQKNNHFASCLNDIRIGKNLKSSIDYINKNSTITTDIPNGAVVLSPRNKEVDRINDINLRKIKEKEYTFECEISGIFPDDRYPAPVFLDLKKGSQVMFLKNDPESGLVNGSICTVHNITDEKISVKTEYDTIVTVEKDEWENFNYIVAGGNINRKVIGVYKQYPLKLAWALTIHKSQGQTLNKVHIDLGAGAFEVGQLYVALSRVTSIEGLSLNRPLQVSDVLVDDIAVKFFEGKHYE